MSGLLKLLKRDLVMDELPAWKEGHEDTLLASTIRFVPRQRTEFGDAPVAMTRVLYLKLIEA